MLYALVVVAGVATGMLMAMFGVGGGAFIVPVIDLLFARLPGVPAPPFKVAVAASLVAISIGSLHRAWQVWRAGRTHASEMGPLVIGSIPATLVGAWLLNGLPDTTLRWMFAIAVSLLGIYTAFGPPRAASAEQTGPHRGLLLAIGAIAGLSSAMFGLGGATLLMPLLTMLVGIAAMRAAEISIVFVAIASVQSLAVLGISWAAEPQVLSDIYPIHVKLIALMTAALIVSQYVFVRLFTRMPDLLRRRLLGLYLMAAGLWMLREAWY